MPAAAEGPAWLHRRAATCDRCSAPIGALEAAGWRLPDGRPDVGFCVTEVPTPTAFGVCAVCSVPSLHLIVVTAWQVGAPEHRWAHCVDACSAHTDPGRWTWVDWRWLMIEGSRLHAGIAG